MAMQSKWSIQLLGGLQARLGSDLVVDRFRTRKAGSIFAYLAHNLKRDHGREELVEIFWPDAEIEAGRDSLRQVLSSFRRQLEPPGVVPAGAVLIAGRATARFNPDAVETDTAQFEALAKCARSASDPADKRLLLTAALELYLGEFLPGNFDDWALSERGRLENLYAAILQELTQLQAQSGDTDQAIDTAYAAVRADAWDDTAHENLLRLLFNAGRYDAVVKQYAERERALAEIGEEPSKAMQEMVKKSRAAVASGDTLAIQHMTQPVACVEVEAPTKPAETRVHLPMQFTRFFGRREELLRLALMILEDGARVVTLTGPGGAGKTRLSIEAGRSVAERAPSLEVYFIALAGTRDGNLLYGVIADTLDIPITSGRPILDTLVEHLATRGLLLILDNFEQIVETAAVRLQELVTKLPLIHAIVSSRQCLNITAEREMPIPPLNVPTPNSTLIQLTGEPAVQLFVDRAQAAMQDFQLTAHNSEIVATLCVRLEGLPLAIELAASWARSLTPAQMLSRLDSRFDLLRSRRRDIDPRHQTLWSAIDWSAQMLPEDARSLLNQLSVFRGSFSLTAVETICNTAALDSLADLTDHSLLMTGQGDQSGETRYRILESVREYGWSLLNADEKSRLGGEHAIYFLDLSRETDAHSFQSDHPEWQAGLGADIENVRAALEWLLSQHDWERGSQMASVLWRFWQYRGLTSEGRRWLDAFLIHEEALTDLTRARAWNAAGMLAGYENDQAVSLAYSEKALDILRREGDSSGVISALVNIGDIAVQAGKYDQAFPIYEDVARIGRESGNRAAQAIAAQGAAIVKHLLEDYDAALTYFSESLFQWRAIGHERGVAMALGGLSAVAAHKGEYERAMTLNHEILETQRRLKELPGVALTLYNMGDLEASRGDYLAARRYLREAITMMADMTLPFYLSYALEAMGIAESEVGHPLRAATFLGAAERMREEVATPLTPHCQEQHDKVVNDITAALPESTWRNAWNDGRAMPIAHAARFACED